MEDELLDDGAVALGKNEVTIDKEKATYPFANTNVNELATKVQEFLLKQGYKLEEGSNSNGIYGKGSKTLRILLGAFIKRFTWKVTVADTGETTTLTFIKDEKGYWGGAIGVVQVKNEFNKITAVLQNFHTKHHQK
jgi:hypothetical protein